MKRDWQTKLRQILARDHRNGVLLFVICHDPERCLQAARIFSPDAYVLHGITGMRPATAGEDVFLLPEEKDITWLNMNRPFLSTYPAKYVLFVTPEMYLIFRSEAPDFTDWASHEIFTFEEEKKVRGPDDVSGVEDDAQMSKEEIAELATYDPQAAVRNPNIPMGDFIELMRKYPLDAAKNPALPLFLLEDVLLRSLMARMVPEWLNNADWNKNNFWSGHLKEGMRYKENRSNLLAEYAGVAIPYLGPLAQHPTIQGCLAYLRGAGPDVPNGQRRSICQRVDESAAPGENRRVWYAVRSVTSDSLAESLRFAAYASAGTAINDHGEHDNTYLWGWNRFLQIAFGVEKDMTIIGKKKPSSVSEQQDLYNRWKGLINMTTGQLQRFLSSDEGKLAGLSRAEASEQGIKSGHDSARALLRIIPSGASFKSALSNWTKTDWEWAKRQVSFVSRMRGNAGPLFDEKGRKTRKHTSLLLWGHDPRKKAQ